MVMSWHSCWTAQSTLHFNPPLACSEIWWCHDTVVGPLKAPYTSTPPSLVVKYGDVMTQLLDRSKHLTLQTPPLACSEIWWCHDTVVGPLKAPYTSSPLACSEIWWCHDTVTRWTTQSTLHFTPPSLVVKYGDVMTQLLDRSKHLTLQTPLACSQIWWCHDTVVGPLKAPYTSPPLACSEIWWCHDTVVGPLKAPYTSNPPRL